MFTTNIEKNQKTYNIQTEDKGKEIAEIETLVYSEGQIMAAWRISYLELLEKGADKEMIHRLMQLQHKEIVDQINAGVLSFGKSEIQLRPKKKFDDNLDEVIIDYLAKNIEVEELKLNIDAAMELKKGNQVIVRVSTRKHITGSPISGAKVIFNLIIDTDSKSQELFKGITDSIGRLQATFFIANFEGTGSLVIDADSIWGKGQVIQYIQD